MTRTIQSAVVGRKMTRGGRFLVQVLAFVTVAVVMGSAGASQASAANGCGPGGTDWRSQVKSRFVVDAPFSFSFGSACNTHDRCYATPWNRVATSYLAAKAACDRQFYADLTRGCYVDYNRSNLAWSWCQYTAYGYYQGVDRWGGGPYRNAQTRR